MAKFTINVMENVKDDNGKLVKDENGKVKEKVGTMDIEVLTFSPLTKSKENDYSFMDTLLDKVNKGIKTIVEKHNDKSSYIDDKGKHKSKATVEQSIKRECEYININTVLVKLFNKTTLNDDDIKAVMAFASYNDKSKTTLDINEIIGMSFNDFGIKYPNIKGTKILEFMAVNKLNLVNGVFVKA